MENNLRKIIQESGFTILELFHYPQHFGNWHTLVQYNQNIYLIANDYKDGWLSLMRQDQNTYQKFFETESSKLKPQQELQIVRQWLAALK